MYSIWDAPSDRDYSEQFDIPSPRRRDLDVCIGCKELVEPGTSPSDCPICQAIEALYASVTDEQGEPLCPVEYELLNHATTLREMQAALKLHDKSTCIHCKKTTGLPVRFDVMPEGGRGTGQKEREVA